MHAHAQCSSAHSPKVVQHWITRAIAQFTVEERLMGGGKQRTKLTSAKIQQRQGRRGGKKLSKKQQRAADLEEAWFDKREKLSSTTPTPLDLGDAGPLLTEALPSQGPGRVGAPEQHRSPTRPCGIGTKAQGPQELDSAPRTFLHAPSHESPTATTIPTRPRSETAALPPTPTATVKQPQGRAGKRASRNRARKEPGNGKGKRRGRVCK
eukprot:m.346042 g.346042  ORF g.346042 m.346042 type:complete len:209 (+) comp27901_c3_seq5:2273-2899(+)